MPAEIQVCCICFNDVGEDSPRVECCNQRFHQECLNGLRSSTCPHCRSELPEEIGIPHRENEGEAYNRESTVDSIHSMLTRLGMIVPREFVERMSDVAFSHFSTVRTPAQDFSQLFSSLLISDAMRPLFDESRSIIESPDFVMPSFITDIAMRHRDDIVDIDGNIRESMINDILDSVRNIDGLEVPDHISEDSVD
jgi:hypothetical protein